MSSPGPDYASDVSAYLSDTTSLDETVQRLTHALASQFQGTSASADDIHFEALWTSVLKAAAGVDPSPASDAHHKLLDLLVATANKGQLRREQDGAVAKHWDGTAWTDLPGFGAAAREVWNEAPAANGRGMSAAEWTSLNTFAARVTADRRLGGAGKASCDLSLFGLWSLRTALEEDRPRTERDTESGTSAAALDTHIPAAIAWLNLAGQVLWALSRENKAFVAEGQSPDPARVGALAKKQVSRGGFSVERWNYWRESLRTLSDARDEASGREKVAKLAYQGLQAMEQIHG